MKTREDAITDQMSDHGNCQMTRWMMSPRHKELTHPAKSCTADGSDASHAANEARGDGIGKREKVAWVARDRRDKGQGLLDVAREMYKLTACTTIEIQQSLPPSSCVHLSPRDSAVALSSCLSSFDICHVLHCVCVCVVVCVASAL